MSTEHRRHRHKRFHRRPSETAWRPGPDSPAQDKVETSESEQARGCPAWLSAVIIFASTALIWVALSWLTNAKNANSILPPNGGVEERMRVIGQ